MSAVDPQLLAVALGPLELRAGELSELAKAIERPADVCLRLRTASVGEELPFALEPVPWHPRGRWVSHVERPGGRLWFAAGDYYVQDAGSLLALTLAQVEPGQRVCDLCAAPGGKSTALLEELNGSGWLLANEAIQSRVAPLQFNLARHGSTNFLLSQHDPEHLPRSLAGFFDTVLVDAPCSGQSLVGRGKQTAAAFQPATIDHCARRQTRILTAAAALVRPGGRLVYSTCTFAHAENEGAVATFLAQHDTWQAVDLPSLAAWRVPDFAGCYRLWPHRDRCAGAFAALLVKEGSAPLAPPSAREPSRRRAGRLRPAAPPAECTAWGIAREPLNFVAAGDQLFAWPDRPPPSLLDVADQGPEFAFRKHATWFPSYALAMRRDGSWRPAQCVALDTRAAERYATGEVVETDERGWAVATWRGRPLGWLKGDGRRGKNHLPKPGRLHVVPLDSQGEGTIQERAS